MKKRIVLSAALLAAATGWARPAAADAAAAALFSASATCAAAGFVPADPAEFAAGDVSADPAAVAAAAAAEQTGVPAAADRAAELLKGLSDGFRTMPDYGVRFAVRAGGQTTRGSYAVEGERYYLTLGDAEVYCDGRLRYEIDNRLHEITLDRVETDSRNILSNPVHAFDFLDTEYAPEVVREGDGTAVVRLTPCKSGTAAGTVTVTVSLRDLRPRSIAYDFDGERIDVEVESIAPLDAPLRTFDRSAYKEYELIDFR